ncbi:hypothetical protein F2Q69_00058432 [Brassica cretica]|uniref:Uncharacterized protein n=1 Tax=Brassica cretica TaxID=69181 RepID=A0A8S9RII8_BRACR|nr:hypothetical protein F2Q69_00058432 [Brassica cretica]
MPSSTRSNKETQLLFSPDPASLEHSIRKEARSSSIDNNACLSLDSRQPPSTQTLVPSTDTRSPPSNEDTHLPSTGIYHPTSINTSVRTSIDTEPRDMVATLILIRDERGDLYDHEGHQRYATGQRIDAQGAAIHECMPNSTKSNKEIQLLFSSVHASLECSIRKERRSSLIDNNTGSSLDSRQPPSTQTPISLTDPRSPPSTEATFMSTDIFHPASIDTSVRTSLDTEPRDMVATLILVRDDNRDLHDQEGHPRNTADDDFWQVVKHKTLQEGDFGVESSISFGGSHWCRSTPDFEYRSTDVNQNRSTASPEHRSTTPAESTAYCNAVRIMAREEFAARHTHPPSLIYVSIDRQTDSAIDRERETVID